MNYLFKSLMLGLVLALLGACTQQEVVEPARTPINTFSAVSSSNPDFRPIAPMTVAWAQPLVVADELSSIKVGAQTADWIEANINQQLQKQGYTLVADSTQADLLVSAAVILDNSHKAQQIQTASLISPHLQADSLNDHQGSLIIVLEKPGVHAAQSLMWRSAIEAFVVRDQLTEQESHARLKSFIARMFNSLPAVSYSK